MNYTNSWQEHLRVYIANLSEPMVGNDDAVESRQELGSESSPRLSDDQLYRALASGQRRRLLCFLLEKGETTLDELTTVLIGWRATEQGTMGTRAEREQVEIRLRHVHLPLLADVGLVTYDRESGTIDITALETEVSELVRRSVDREQPPST